MGRSVHGEARLAQPLPGLSLTAPSLAQDGAQSPQNCTRNVARRNGRAQEAWGFGGGRCWQHAAERAEQRVARKRAFLQFPDDGRAVVLIRGVT